MTIDEAIAKAEYIADCRERCAEHTVTKKAKESISESAVESRQLAEWLKELKDLREENKVLMQECDRLIKEKGKLLKKIAEQNRLLLLANADIYYHSGKKWEYEADVLKLIGDEENGTQRGNDNS